MMILRRNRFSLVVWGMVATITLLTHEQFTIILYPKSTIRLHSLLETIYIDNTTHKLSHNCQQVVHLGLCGCSRTQQLAICPLQVTKHTDQSTCGSTATLRGPGQKVVSYVAYGSFPNDYYKGLEKLVYEVPKFYPGWSMRVYLNWAQVNLRDWACALACNNSHLDICDAQNLPGYKDSIRSLYNLVCIGNISESFPMTWRFSVMGDPLVNRYIVRDSDTPLIQREVDAVNEWISLGKCFHAMRDHIYHHVPVMGGMWGGCNYWQPSKNKEIRTMLFQSRKKYGGDQHALTAYLFPWAKKNMTSHSSYPCKKFPGSLPFPTRRVNGTFIGSRDYRKTNDTIFRICPWECRPKLHKDWERC